MNFPQLVVIHIVKGFSIVNEAEVFLEFPCFFYDPMDVGNLTFSSSAFSKSSVYLWKLLIHILLKPSLKEFEQSGEKLKDREGWHAAVYGVAKRWTQLCN